MPKRIVVVGVQVKPNSMLTGLIRSGQFMHEPKFDLNAYSLSAIIQRQVKTILSLECTGGDHDCCPLGAGMDSHV